MAPITTSIEVDRPPDDAFAYVTVSPLGDGRRSRVTIELDFTGRGIGKLLVPLAIRPSARKEMPATLQRLRARLEPSDS